MKKAKLPRRPTVDNSRKTIRKQKRQQKKQHRQEHYLKKKTAKDHKKYVPGMFVKRPTDSPEPKIEIKVKKRKHQHPSEDIVKMERRKEMNEANRLRSDMEEQRRKVLLQANEDEDKIIKKLEKQLGLNKSKNKNNYFADDGLNYLLEICDKSTTEQIVAAEKQLANVENESDFEEDLAVVTGKELNKKKENKIKKERVIKDQTHDISDEDNLSDNHAEEELSENDEELSLNTDNGETEDESEIAYGSDLSDEETELSHKNMKNSSKKSKINEPDKVVNKVIEKKKESKPMKSKEKIIPVDELNKIFSEDEVSHLSGDNDDLDGFSCSETIDENDKPNITKNDEKPDVWEDIYGRKRDKEGNVIKEEKGIYIPPHLRNKDSTSDKNLAQLERQIKSVLNKLSGNNLHWACNSIELLYSSNSRHSVNSALWRAWCLATLATAATPARLMAEHAALLAVLHANVATEIGAYFLQEMTKLFDAMSRTPQSQEDKTLDNLVACLAHLYSFKIYHANLLYDILGRLLEELTEKNIDCVLVVLRTVGGVLRKEEPLALKNFINETQARVTKLNENVANGSRIKYLLEVLMAVKNNNLNKIPNYDPTYTEHLKKHIRTVIRRGNYVTPLNIRLDDLLKADERGKWWIVGSAWEGNPTRMEEKSTPVPLPTQDRKLLELARKQRMNTDVRRSIFCVIMAAEDFMDAFEKLQHLGLKGQQEREVVHVLMACCLQESAYNPYYSVLALKLCQFDRKYQLSIQYTVWDKIKELETLSSQHMSNLAQFLVHLIMEKGLPISVLKVIEFSDLNKCSVRFMRQILLAILMNANFQASLEVFHRISKPPKLHMFRESLRLFIQHFLIKNAGKKNSISSDEEMATLKERTLEIDKILTMFDSKMKL